MIRILPLLLAVSSLASDCKDKEIRGTRDSTNLNVQVLGSSGKFKLFPSGADNDNKKFIMFSFDEVEESDGSHAIKKFSGMCLDWVLDYEVIKGVNTTHVQLSASDVDVGKDGRLTYIGFDIWFIEQESEFSNGGESVTAPEASLKFSINVTGWPFSSLENKLRIDLDVKSSKSGLLKKQSGSKRKFQIDDGTSGGFIQFADTVLIDGRSAPASVIVERNDKTKREIKITLPNFQESAIYDPVVTLSSSTHFPVWGYVLIALGVVCVAGIGICCACRRKQKDEGYQPVSG